jgi:hypothetical protein
LHYSHLTPAKLTTAQHHSEVDLYVDLQKVMLMHLVQPQKMNRCTRPPSKFQQASIVITGNAMNADILILDHEIDIIGSF